MAFPAEAEDWVRQSLPHRTWVDATLPDGRKVRLPVQGGSLTFDSGRIPRVYGSVSVPIPADQTVLDALDPRLRVRVEVHAGYRYDRDTEHVEKVADCILTGSTSHRPQNDLSLTFAGDEVLGASRKKIPGDTNPPTTGLNAAVQFVADRIVSPETAVLASDFGQTNYGAADLSGATYDHGTDWASILQDICNRTGAQVYVNELRQWRVTGADAFGTVKHKIHGGARGTLISSDAGRLTEAFANRVTIRYAWEDANGDEVSVTGKARIQNGPLAVGLIGHYDEYLERESQATLTQANKAAKSRLLRLSTKGRSLGVEAVSAYWLRPTDTVEVTLETGAPALWLIDTVTFDLGTGRMHAALRLPYDTRNIILEGE